ncbi:MAG: hypothetical protein LBU73_03900 [Helicobacteraceae bacterium]|jgi:antitoxin component YwqK of YwqJK toxin-antitoxin module|nr:hypothetical protein [Helicobacteraceae bacterium]
MKRILIAILSATALLATGCSSPKASNENPDYKVYILDKTARFDKESGKCMDMNGNLLPGKAKVQEVDKYGDMRVRLCIDGEAIEQHLYYKDGVRGSTVPLKNGKREGVKKTFYDYNNGLLKEERPYKNGVTDGIVKTYDWYDGRLKQEVAWKNGAKEGEAKVFRENGKFFAVVTYKKDKAISGVCHLTNGQKVPLTGVELENWNRGGSITCD